MLKKVIIALLYLLCAVSMVLICSEVASGRTLGEWLLWELLWGFVAFCSYRILIKLDKRLTQ